MKLEMPYSRPDLEAMKANLTACTEAFLAAESAQEQIAQYDRVTDLSVEFNTMGSLANARHTIDTRDEFATPVNVLRRESCSPS